MKVSKSKVIIGLIIFILFISIANSCSKKHKNIQSDTSSVDIESSEPENSNQGEDEDDIDLEDSTKEDPAATDSNELDKHPIKSINDYPDFWNLVDKSHPASKLNINSNKLYSPKSICESKDYYYVLRDDSIYVYSKDTGNSKISSSLEFVNTDYNENEKNTKNQSKKDIEKSRDYNKDKIDAICASENNLWVCHSSNKTSTITKFNLSSITTPGKLKSKHSFNLKYKCNFLVYNDGILWTGQNKSHGASSLYGYSVNDDRKDFWKKDPKYKYSISIPNYIDSIAINNNRFFLHENKYKDDDSHIYVFDNVNIETSDLKDINAASKTINIPRRAACINYSQDRLIILFSNYRLNDNNNINSPCPIII